MYIKHILVVFSLLFLASCSPYDKVLKSKDYAFKLQKAHEYFEQGKWMRAGELYTQLLPVYKATKEYEDIYYKYAYTKYNAKDYLGASYHFKNFTEFFPSSTKADECMFMHGVALYKDSPRPSLDPTSTYKARDVLVTFVNTHPGSKYTVEALKYIQECTEKLETKNFNAALLYFNMGQYNAASIAFQQLMETFVESKQSDFYSYMKFKSYYLYATKSYTNKQELRFVDAIGYYNDFKNFYPNSIHLPEADKLYASANKELKQLRNEHK